ncbi:gem-associated protein 5-like, partial [Diadema setosum]|uniref:gem-associated protein 5-like n=1 Tax=Diadema setosum TaxID=31175 RepID=UPI003B3AD7A0
LDMNILPPSPNWYFSRASAVSDEGIFAFATRNNVFLLDVRSTPPTFVGSLSEHTERVTAVSCCRAAGTTHLCATGGDDATIKIWNLKQRTVLQQQKFQENKITVIDWSRADRNIITAGDDQGRVIYWNVSSNDTTILKPDKASVYSLSCSPHKATILAVGYKDGRILVVDALAKRDQILHLLRGHEDEVQSLAWAPFPGEAAFSRRKGEEAETEASPEEGCILVSGGKDRTLRFWSTSRGRPVKVVNLPPRGGGQRPHDRGDDPGQKSKVWVSLHWSKERPQQLISSSHGGDMVLWDLSRAGSPRWEVLGGDGDQRHHRAVFAVLGWAGDPNRVVTTSMDRQVISWHLPSKSAEWSLPTLGGFVYSISSSPLDPARLALGVGDNMIRVWNTGSRGKTYDVTTLWQGIKSKVTVVCWHPLRENSLAYGTEDGRVGLYNLSVHGKPPQASWTYHKKTVYSLSWGPPCPAPDRDHSPSHHLYSCGGDGMIYQHDPTKLDQEASNVNALIKRTNNLQHLLPQRSEVEWKADGRAVAIGNSDGSIEILAPPDLRILCTIHVQNKIINCLRWYPDDAASYQPVEAGGDVRVVGDGRASLPPSTTDHKEEILPDGSSDATSQSSASKTLPHVGDAGPASEVDDPGGGGGGGGASRMEGMPMGDRSPPKRRFWLASGSNENEVEIYDLAGLFGEETTHQLSVPMTSSHQTLRGHSARVTSLAWSPHGDGRLLSTSFDNSAQIWDAGRGEPIANFQGHSGRVFSGLWSCTSPDIVLTGGEDFCVCTWCLSELKHVRPPKATKKVFGGHKRPNKKGKKLKGRNLTQDSQRENSRDAVSMATESQVKENNNIAQQAGGSPNVSEMDAVAEASALSSNHMPGAGEVMPSLEERGAERTSLEQMKRDLLAQVEEIERGMGKDARVEDGGGRAEQDDEKGLEEEEEEDAYLEGEPAKERGDVIGACLDGVGLPQEMGRGEPASSAQSQGVVRDMSGPSGRKGRHKRYKSLFPVSGAKDNRGRSFMQQDCIDLAKMKRGNSLQTPMKELCLHVEISSCESTFHLGLFADRRNTIGQMQEEASQHAKSDSRDKQYQLDFWQGNILSALRDAMRRGQISDWMVSMAAQAGRDVWSKVCEAYAEQLASQDHIHRAVIYFVMCGQVYKAIALLKKNAMFRDAIALARVRLLPSDPVLHDLYMTWATQLESSNSAEQAARCYLAADQCLNAVRLLARKGDHSSLQTALNVAVVSDLVGDALVESIATRYLNSALATGQWREALEVFSRHEKYKDQAQLLLVYEVLVWCLVHQGYLTPSHTISYTEGHSRILDRVCWTDVSASGCSWSVPLHDETPLLDGMFQRADMSSTLSHDLNSIDDVAMPTSNLSGDINKMLRFAAQHLLVCLRGQSSGQPEVAMLHLCRVLKACHECGYPAIAVCLLQLAAPLGTYSLDDLQSKVQGDNQMAAMLTCVRAQYQLTQLYHMMAGFISSEHNNDAEAKGDVTDSTQPVGDKKDSSLVGEAERISVETQSSESGDGMLTSPSAGDEVISNPRTEGHLFEELTSLKNPLWPMSLSKVRWKEWLVEQATAKGDVCEPSDATQNVHVCSPSKADAVARLLSMLEQGAEVGGDREDDATEEKAVSHDGIVQRGDGDNSCSGLERTDGNTNVVMETDDAGNSLLLQGKEVCQVSPSETPQNSRPAAAKCESQKEISASSTSSLDQRVDKPSDVVVSNSPKVNGSVAPSEVDVGKLVEIKAILLDEQFALPHLVCHRLDSLLPHSPASSKACPEQRWRSRSRKLARDLATLTSDELRRVTSQASARDALQPLRNQLQKEVQYFPDPVSSCAALFKLTMTLLQAESDIQSGNMDMVCLARQLCDWCNCYIDSAP